MKDLLQLDDFDDIITNDPELVTEELNFDDDQVCFYAPEDYDE